MKNKIKIGIIIILTVIEIFNVFLMYQSLQSKKTQNLQKESTKTFALMLEQVDGRYIESVSSSWPSNNYVFNTEMSNCVDIEGEPLYGIMTYDNRTKTAYVKSREMSFCWLYFDLDTTPPTIDSFYLGGIDNPQYIGSKDTSIYVKFLDDDVSEYCLTLTDDYSSCSWIPLSSLEISNKTITSPYSLVDEEGEQQRYIHIRDVAGNVSSLDDSVVLDKTGPTVTIAYNGTNFTANLSDALSGVSDYKLTSSNATPTSWDAITPVVSTYSFNHNNTDGTYYVHARDLVGNSNKSSIRIESFSITKGTSKNVSLFNTSNATCSSLDTSFATCSISGNNVSISSLKGGSTAIVITNNGSVSQVIKVTSYEAPSNPTIRANDGILSDSWHKSSVTLTFSGSTIASGNGSVTYYYGKSESSMNSTGTSVTDTTGATYFVKACNSLNTSVCSNTVKYILKIDTTPPSKPTMNMVFGNWEVYPNNTWTNKAVYAGRVNGNPSPTGSVDNESGVAKYQISENNNTWIDYNYNSAVAPYKMSTTGTHNRYFRACNNATLCGEALVLTAKIDTASPTVSITAKKKSAGTTVSSGSWSSEGLNFTLTSSGVGPSGATIKYCKDTKNTCTPNTTIASGTAITSYNGETGTYYIRYQIIGGNGYSSTVASYTAKVDTTPPGVTWAYSSGYTQGSGYKHGVTVTVTCTDSVSTATGGTSVVLNASTTSPKTISGTCRDALGNSKNYSKTFTYNSSSVCGSYSCTYSNYNYTTSTSTVGPYWVCDLSENITRCVDGDSAVSTASSVCSSKGYTYNGGGSPQGSSYYTTCLATTYTCNNSGYTYQNGRCERYVTNGCNYSCWHE